MRYTAFYFRHWWPRLGGIAGSFSKMDYSNSVHYGILWLGVIRYKRLAIGPDMTKQTPLVGEFPAEHSER